MVAHSTVPYAGHMKQPSKNAPGGGKMNYEKGKYRKIRVRDVFMRG